MVRTGHHPLRRLPPGVALADVLVLAACGADTNPSASASAPPSAEAAESAVPSVSAASSSAPIGSAFAGAWVDATAETIGETAEYTNSGELADLGLLLSADISLTS